MKMLEDAIQILESKEPVKSGNLFAKRVLEDESSGSESTFSKMFRSTKKIALSEIPEVNDSEPEQEEIKVNIEDGELIDT